MTLRLVAHADGGHSSTPPRESAIGRLARAVVAVEANPMPARLSGVVGGLLDAAAPHMDLLSRLAIQNRWLLEPLVERKLAASPATDAMLRTTTAVTMIEGGVKENVLPATATATVNFRLAPGDASEAVIEHVRRAIDDPDVEIEVGRITEPSPVADTGSASYALLVDAIGAVAPDAIVAPALVLGGTDTKHYVRLAGNSYRFAPFVLGPGDLSRIHGIDERIAVENLEGDLVPFYRTLLRSTDRLPDEARDVVASSPRGREGPARRGAAGLRTPPPGSAR
jgi:carboxypeptidase PM20D1